MGLLGWESGWVGLCLTCSHPQVLGLPYLGGPKDDTPKPEPTAKGMPPGSGYRCWGARHALAPCLKRALRGFAESRGAMGPGEHPGVLLTQGQWRSP